jgi:alkylation response protein AidB-like acyl-CoA dehydrogenase
VNFEYSEAENEAGDLARRILGDYATNERLKAIERDGGAFDTALWQALADADLLGVGVPESLGGLGLGFFGLCRVLREVGRAVAPIPAWATLVLSALPLAEFGAPEGGGDWIGQILRGERILTAALSESATRDPLRPATTFATHPDGVRLSGEKTNVPFAAHATHLLVPATDHDGNIGLFYIALDGAGVEVLDQSVADGLPHSRVELHDAPALAWPGVAPGAAALRWIVERATVACCFLQLGVTERALEMTAAYSRERVQFDRPIGSFQAVHQRAADAYINVEGIRLSALEAAWRLSAGRDAAGEVAVAKYWAAEGGSMVSYACQHLHGGIGIDTDYPLHRYFKWAIQLEHELGSARDQLDRIATELSASR